MERRSIVIRGVVQGVGFRPFVYGLACRFELSGFVMNQTGSVWIEAEGDPARLDSFVSSLVREAPPLACINDVQWEHRPLRGGSAFDIRPSQRSEDPVLALGPDAGTCPACLSELFDPDDRRFLYPFINCVNCGPRLTIVTGVPYDRERTTMARFAMCVRCRSEYEDPASRRFHAQANACPACGPKIFLGEGNEEPSATVDAVASFAAAVLQGKIGALKGLGGYHPVCDATNPRAISDLRQRKGREEKPLAIMVPHLASAEALCHIDALERELLESWRRPIVLLRRRAGVALAEGVAPGTISLGVMLPYTPLHELLLRATGDIPLVMTSANRSDEPIIYQNDDAEDRLKEVADLFLHHDRPIQVRCDDSVSRVVAGQEMLLRRSRGYAPQPITLPIRCPQPLLALGGQLKVTFGLGRASEAVLSHHLGDLDHFEAYRQYERDIALYEDLYELRPTALIHDLHPDYASTRYALRRQAQTGQRSIPVQHHHAHLASCLAENGWTGPAIGVIFDGAGLGTDQTIWGGEFLTGDLLSFERSAHLRPVPLPGGEQAIREPWRVAMSHLVDAGLDTSLVNRRGSGASARVVETMIRQRINAPLTSSAGRLFDAVSSLIGLRDRVTYEGQAAVELEHLATGKREAGRYEFDVEAARSDGGSRLIVDTRPMIRQIAGDVVGGVDSATIARRFHSTLLELVCRVCGMLRRQTHLATVALSGGVYMNVLLLTETVDRLTADGFRVLRHRAVPPNDGGLSLGQLAVAAARLEREAQDAMASV